MRARKYEHALRIDRQAVLETEEELKKKKQTLNRRIQEGSQIEKERTLLHRYDDEERRIRSLMEVYI